MGKRAREALKLQFDKRLRYIRSGFDYAALRRRVTWQNERGILVKVNKMQKKTMLSSCPGEACHGGCIHRTYVEGGKIVKVERFTYPDGEKGDICLKGVAGARLPYHPDRLKYPLKRAGKRGEGKWERITWEQALDEIADKLKKIRGEYSPKSVAIMPSLNSRSPVDGIQHLLGNRLVNLLQATIPMGVGIDCNHFFAAYFGVGTCAAHYIDPRTLVEGKTRYMIAWGTNPAEMAPRWWRFIREAQKNGAKLVDIGLIHDPTAKAADWWIPVQAGSDGALALAMVDIIIKAKLYDEDYIAKHTNGPFLVRTDNGKLLRESDLSKGAAQNYVVWDKISGQPRVVVPYTEGPAGITPALTGAYKPGGIECKPAFQLLAELAGRYSPKKASGISGVPAETIEKLAREYAKTKPAAILLTHGLRYLNGGNAYRAMNTLAALTGNIGVRGGGIICGQGTGGGNNAPLLRLNDLPIVFPTESFAKPLPMTQLFNCAIAGEPYPIKALMAYVWNPVHTFPNPQRWIEDVFPKLELIVVSDIFMTATADYADYVLPDCTVFEREDMTVGYGGHLVYLDKAIEPMYECRPPIYLWSELARRLGFGGHFDKSIDEWIELRLKSEDPSVAGIEPPLTLERLKNEKIIRTNVPKEIFHPFLDKKFLTPSGRVEFYNEELIPTGDALPVFREQLDSPRSALVEKYPLVFNTANNIFFVHSMFSNEPSILEKYQKEPHLSINPLDAEKRKISDGEVVIAYNDRGSFKVKAMISETVPPGVVHIPHGWGPKQFIEGHLQNLVPSLASQESRDEAREIFWSIARDRVGPTGFPEGLAAYSPDILFDSLCEVKKAER